MRVKELLDFALVQTGRARVGEIPNDLHDHALDALNLQYKKVWQIFPWQHEKEIELELTSVLGTLTIPNYIDSVTAVRIGNDEIPPISENIQVRVDAAGLTRSGSAYGYMWGEVQPVLTQPASALALRVKSSSASDSSGTVRVYGVVSGVDTYEDFTLNGTNNVDGSSTFTEIHKISKPVTTGRITVLDQSDNEFGTIAPWHTQPEYRQMLFVPTPDENKTVTIHALRRFQPLIGDEDGIEPSGLEPAVLHLLQATLLRQVGKYDLGGEEERLATDAIKIFSNRENEINATDNRMLPASGMFGDLGEPDSHGGNGWPFYATR